MENPETIDQDMKMASNVIIVLLITTGIVLGILSILYPPASIARSLSP